MPRLAYEENPGVHSVPSDIFMVMVVGMVLSFGGTAASYIWYTASAADLYSSRRWPLPIVTDMFGDWPLLSCVTTGLGVTLLFTALVAIAIARIPLEVGFRPRTMLVYTAITAQASVWIVIPSSKKYGVMPNSGIVGWIHEASTLVFIVSCVWALHTAHSICDFLVEAIAEQQEQASWSRMAGGAETRYQGIYRSMVWPNQPRQCSHATSPGAGDGVSPGLVVRAPGYLPALSQRAEALRPYGTACSVCVWVAWLGVFGAIVSVACIVFIDDKNIESYLWQAFVVSELSILFFSGLGYTLVVYIYSEIEAVASTGMHDMPQMKSRGSGSIWYGGIHWR